MLSKAKSAIIGWIIGKYTIDEYALKKVDIKGVRELMEAIQSFIDQLARMQWSDYLDIILVAFLIYKFLPLIRTPSTMRIARAVLVVVVIAWATDVLHL